MRSGPTPSAVVDVSRGNWNNCPTYWLTTTQLNSHTVFSLICFQIVYRNNDVPTGVYVPSQNNLCVVSLDYEVVAIKKWCDVKLCYANSKNFTWWLGELLCCFLLAACFVAAGTEQTSENRNWYTCGLLSYIEHFIWPSLFRPKSSPYHQVRDAKVDTVCGSLSHPADSSGLW